MLLGSRLASGNTVRIPSIPPKRGQQLVQHTRRGRHPVHDPRREIEIRIFGACHVFAWANAFTRTSVAVVLTGVEHDATSVAALGARLFWDRGDAGPVVR